MRITAIDPADRSIVKQAVQVETLMRSINDRLGFRPVETEGLFQKPRALRHR